MRVVREQAAQRSCGYPIPGSPQGQVGWVFEKSDLLEGGPAHDRGLDYMVFKGPFLPKPPIFNYQQHKIIEIFFEEIHILLKDLNYALV